MTITAKDAKHRTPLPLHIFENIQNKRGVSISSSSGTLKPYDDAWSYHNPYSSTWRHYYHLLNPT